jgi:hypothetical protein
MFIVFKSTSETQRSGHGTAVPAGIKPLPEQCRTATAEATRPTRTPKPVIVKKSPTNFKPEAPADQVQSAVTTSGFRTSTSESENLLNRKGLKETQRRFFGITWRTSRLRPLT